MLNKNSPVIIVNLASVASVRGVAGCWNNSVSGVKSLESNGPWDGEKFVKRRAGVNWCLSLAHSCTLHTTHYCTGWSYLYSLLPKWTSFRTPIFDLGNTFLVIHVYKMEIENTYVQRRKISRYYCVHGFSVMTSQNCSCCMPLGSERRKKNLDSKFLENNF